MDKEPDKEKENKQKLPEDILTKDICQIASEINFTVELWTSRTSKACKFPDLPF